LKFTYLNVCLNVHAEVERISRDDFDYFKLILLRMDKCFSSVDLHEVFKMEAKVLDIELVGET
jgi:hypothetical protein